MTFGPILLAILWAFLALTAVAFGIVLLWLYFGSGKTPTNSRERVDQLVRRRAAEESRPIVGSREYDGRSDT